MQILNSWFDLQNIVGSDIGTMSFDFKGVGGLHVGHESLVTAAKSNFTTTVACFFNHHVLIHDIFGGPPDNFNWDETYCTTWCQNLNLDYMVITEPNFKTLVDQNYDSTAIWQQVETYYQNENYDVYYNFPNVVDLKRNDLKYFLYFYVLKDMLNVNNYKRVLSWTDGIISFIQKYHYDKYKQPGLYTFIDPVRRSDGLQYSTRLLSAPVETINFYLQVKSNLDQWGNSQIDKATLDSNLLTLAIENNFNVAVPYYYENMFGFNKLAECYIGDRATGKLLLIMVEKY